MYRVKLFVLGMEMEFEAADQKELWKRVALFQALPETCPIDGTRARLSYRFVEKYDYYEVINETGIYKMALGQYQTGGDLFVKPCWSVYDADNKKEIVLWENGRFTQAGEQARNRHQPRPVKQPAIEQPGHREGRQPALPPAAEPPPSDDDERHVFDDPNAGAFAAKKPELITKISAAAACYGERKKTEVLRIASEVAGDTIEKIVDMQERMNYTELERVLAIVELDAWGKAAYPNGQWDKTLRLVTKDHFTPLYQMSVDQVRKLKTTIGEPVKA